MPPQAEDSGHGVAIESDDGVQSLGMPGAMHHSLVVEAVDKILAGGKKRGHSLARSSVEGGAKALYRKGSSDVAHQCLRPPNWDLETIFGEYAGGTSISP